MTSLLPRKSYVLYFVPVAVLLIGLCITFLLWNASINDARRVQQEKFNFRVNEIISSTTERLKSYEQVLLGVSGLFAASRSVERNEFHEYASKLQLDQSFPGIQGVGFALRIPAAEKQQHIGQIRKEGFPAYSLRPEGERDPYTAIIYLEPFDWRNQRAFGFDMYSEPVRRAAMSVAWEAGVTALTGKVKLVQESGKDVQWGFLMYIPVYRNGVPADSLDARRKNLVGWAYAPFRMNNFMQGMLGKQRNEIQSTLDMEIFDGDALTPENRMYDSNPKNEAGSASAGLYSIRKIEFGRHVWSVAVRSMPEFEMEDVNRQLWIMVSSGGAISVLMAFVVWLLLTGRARALAQAESMGVKFHESETRTGAIMENLLDGVITINVQGIVESFNKEAENIFGYAANEVIGKNIKMLMPEPYHGEHDGYLQNYVSTGNRKIIGIGREVTGRRKDGSVFPMDLAVSEIRTEATRMFTGIVRDITERIKIERMKSEFVSTVSHELRTPLTSIHGALGLIAGGAAGELPAQAKSLVDIACKNSERLILLVNDILDMEKIVSGKMAFSMSPVDLVSLVQNAMEASRAYGEQVNVRFMLADPFPSSCVVSADPDRLMQVMANFLSNAAKFSPPGEVVSISVSGNGEKARVAVTDHGPGIPEAFRDKIFQKFSQADSSDSRQKGGTGLGLSISKALVERMGGKIGYETEAGKGATFFFEFAECAGDMLQEKGARR